MRKSLTPPFDRLGARPVLDTGASGEFYNFWVDKRTLFRVNAYRAFTRESALFPQVAFDGADLAFLGAGLDMDGHVGVYERRLDILLEVVAEIVRFTDIGIFPHDNMQVDETLCAGLARAELMISHNFGGVLFDA